MGRPDTWRASSMPEDRTPRVRRRAQPVQRAIGEATEWIRSGDADDDACGGTHSMVPPPWA